MAEDVSRLIESAQRGDATALDALLGRYLPGLRAFVRLRAGPTVRAHESASDIAQSVCREVLQNLSTFKYGGETGFKHWLYATALRKLQKRDEHWRAQKREAARVVGDEQALLDAYRNVSSPSRRAMTKEELARIEKAFDELGDDEREVITLARVVGLPHKEIAEAMGRTEGATRVLLHRALAKLAEKLDVGD
ncbi:MAG: sigma-70 family RNA polymerase sigma factor [Planctomycetes bacterium]|nr:sigma-70 family RNA polymerase sigma factor [Planctomycetota bacterium]